MGSGERQSHCPGQMMAARDKLKEHLRQQRTATVDKLEEVPWSFSLHGMYHRQKAEVADIEENLPVADKGWTNNEH